MRAALRKISERMPDFLESGALEDLLGEEMIDAWVGMSPSATMELAMVRLKDGRLAAGMGGKQNQAISIKRLITLSMMLSHPMNARPAAGASARTRFQDYLVVMVFFVMILG